MDQERKVSQQEIAGFLQHEQDAQVQSVVNRHLVDELEESRE